MAKSPLPPGATVQDILDAEQDSLDELDARMNETAKMLKPGKPGRIDTCLKRMDAERSRIFDESNDAILASADLDAALKAMKEATANLKSVAANMTNATGVIGNIDKYVGYAAGVASAAQTITGK